jgi:WD40 repeat protein
MTYHRFHRHSSQPMPSKPIDAISGVAGLGSRARSAQGRDIVHRKQSRILTLILSATMLTNLPIHAETQNTQPKVGVFVPSLQGSWDKTIPAAAFDIVLAPDGKTFAMNCHDLTVRVFRSEDGHEVSTIKLRGVRASAKTMAYSPDGTRLATARHYNHRTEIQVWNPANGKQLWRRVTNDSHLGQLGFRSNDHLVRYAADGIREWSLKTNEQTFQELHREQRRPHSFAVSNVVKNDGRMEFACAWRDLQIHDLAAHRKIRQLNGLPLGSLVRSIALSPQGNRIATLATNGSTHHVGMWDAQTGKSLWSSQPKRNYPLRAAFSPDGRYLATAGMHPRLAEPENSREPTYAWGKSGYYAIDGSIAWTRWTPSFRSSHNAILLWDVTTGAMKKAILHPEYHIVGMTFTDDGTGLLVTGTENRQVAAGPKSSAMVARLSLVGAFTDSSK